MFVRFIEQVKIRMQQPLPGEEVQLLMAPYNRISVRQLNPKLHEPQKSAVLILLFPVGNEIHTLLIHRPVYEGVHSGQVSFPGGKFEEIDVDLSQTAIREAFEEVGVQPSSIEIIGKLSDLYISPSNFLVSPYIAFVRTLPDFIIDTHEVQKIISVNLFHFKEVIARSEKIITHSSGIKIKTPYYEIEGLTVWGATAMIISELTAIVEESKIISF